MSSADKHLKYAQRHLAVANKLTADPETLPWAGVVLFYAARDVAHAVMASEANLPEHCRHPTSHGNENPMKPGTNVVIKTYYRHVEPSYMDLYAMSKGVRYQGRQLDDRMYAEYGADFRDLCEWAAASLTRAGRERLPDWLTRP